MEQALARCRSAEQEKVEVARAAARVAEMVEATVEEVKAAAEKVVVEKADAAAAVLRVVVAKAAAAKVGAMAGDTAGEPVAAVVTGGEEMVEEVRDGLVRVGRVEEMEEGAMAEAELAAAMEAVIKEVVERVVEGMGMAVMGVAEVVEVVREMVGVVMAEATAVGGMAEAEMATWTQKIRAPLQGSARVTRLVARSSRTILRRHRSRTQKDRT